MEITDQVIEVFKGYHVGKTTSYGTNYIAYGFEVKIPNKWNAYLSFNDSYIQLTNYHGPCSHLVFEDIDVYNLDDLKSVLNLTLEYLSLLDPIDNILKSAKDIKTYKRDLKIKEIIS